MPKSNLSNEERIAQGLKPLGRPKDAASGPRPVYWVAAGLVNGKLVHEMCYDLSGDPSTRDKFSEEDAIAQFEAKYKFKPASIHGPFYKQMGSKQNKKSDVLEIDPKNIKLSGHTSPGIYSGWEGFASEIENLPEAVLFVPLKAIDGSNKKAPEGRVILRSAISFPSSNSTVNTSTN